MSTPQPLHRSEDDSNMAEERVQRACYPGSFNPCTIAHLGIADAAFQQLGVVSVELVISESALGKPEVDGPSAQDRARAIGQHCRSRPWLDASVTNHRLLADIAIGFDWLIIGADKWAQIIDPFWYDDDKHRSVALSRLPALAIAPRPPWPMPTDDDLTTLAGSLPSPLLVRQLRVPDLFAEISSTAVRRGRSDWHAAR